MHINGHDCPGAISEARQVRSTAPVARPFFARQHCPGRTRSGGRARGVSGLARDAAVERLRKLRRVADLIEQRVFHIAAALSLEVGKNRMEALGEAQETADFFNLYADESSEQRLRTRTAGRSAAELPFAQPQRDAPVRRVGGDRAVQLSARTGRRPGRRRAGHRQHGGVQGRDRYAVVRPPAGRLPARCRLPAGRVQLPVSGDGGDVGDALVAHPRTAGITFTGSAAVGMAIYRSDGERPYPRPCIAEMGGKNACIVTARADLERAATGIVRSAFGMGGQKCSALSRLYVDADGGRRADRQLQEKIAAIKSATRRAKATGWVPSRRAARCRTTAHYCRAPARLAGDASSAAASSLRDGRTRTRTVRRADAGRSAGHASAVARGNVPADRDAVPRRRSRGSDARWRTTRRSGSPPASTASDDDVPWFHEHIEAGVTYANRPQGATTGAWPGYQPFGGWKGSGTTGKAIASFYYLAQYLREQSQTVVE